MKKTDLIMRSPDLLETELDHEVVLMSIEKGNYYGLEGSARHIWQLLEQPKTIEELVRLLSAAYVAPEAHIEQDLHEFLQKMLAKGVVSLA